MGSKKSSSSSATTTQQTDSRIVAGEGATVLGQGSSYSALADYSISDSSQRSFTDASQRNYSTAFTDASQRNFIDSSQRDYSTAISDASQRNFTDASSAWSDSSNRSVTTINAADPGAVQLGQFNAELLGAVSGQQTDAVRALAGFGAEGLRTMGQSVTDLYGRAGSNTAQAWGATLNASEKLLGRVLDASDRTTDAARAVASTAIATYQPAENKAQDTALKLGVIVAAGVALVFLMRKG